MVSTVRVKFKGNVNQHELTKSFLRDPDLLFSTYDHDRLTEEQQRSREIERAAHMGKEITLEVPEKRFLELLASAEHFGARLRLHGVPHTADQRAEFRKLLQKRGQMAAV